MKIKKFRVLIDCMNNEDVPGGVLTVESDAAAGEGSNFVYLTIGEITLELRAVEVLDAVRRITANVQI